MTGDRSNPFAADRRGAERADKPGRDPEFLEAERAYRAVDRLSEEARELLFLRLRRRYPELAQAPPAPVVFADHTHDPSPDGRTPEAVTP